LSTGVVVCRGCCCGSVAKRPHVDHAAVVARLERSAAAHPQAMRLRTSECLGPCEHADVVVVVPSQEGRRRGGRPVWFGLVDEQVLEALTAWVVDGGPGLVPVPDLLDLNRVARPASAARRVGQVG
jgi:(2Fe-2S) ferredoxin